MLAEVQQLQTVLTRENPVLVMKVDVDYSETVGRYLTIMAGLWDGNQFYKYKCDYIRQDMSTLDARKVIRNFREEVESWEGK